LSYELRLLYEKGQPADKGSEFLEV